MILTVNPWARIMLYLIAGVLESNGGAMGDSLTLMSRMLFPNAPEPELRLLAEAAQSEPGAAGMLSTVGTDVMSMRAPTMPVGQVTLSHMPFTDDPEPRRHLVRALVEGYACAVRANIEQLDALLEPESTETNSSSITLCGGMSRSAFFGQLLANISARDVQVAGTYQTSALGAAICAGVATGDYPDFATAAQQLCTVRQTISARHDLADVNAQLFDTWSRFRVSAETSTAPIAVDHLLPRVLQEPKAAISSSAVPADLQALGVRVLR